MKMYKKVIVADLGDDEGENVTECTGSEPQADAPETKDAETWPYESDITNAETQAQGPETQDCGIGEGKPNEKVPCAIIECPCCWKSIKLCATPTCGGDDGGEPPPEESPPSDEAMNNANFTTEMTLPSTTESESEQSDVPPDAKPSDTVYQINFE